MYLLWGTFDLALVPPTTSLKKSGFGYRAKYIVESAKVMHSKGGEAWALGMRGQERDEVRKELIALCGVGPKVQWVETDSR